jgi:hypothetical protein
VWWNERQQCQEGREDRAVSADGGIRVRRARYTCRTLHVFVRA